MTISTALENGTLTLRPEGRLDSVTSDDLSAVLAEHFTADVGTLVLDLSGVDFISSKGLRVLVSVYKGLNGRTMTLTGANTSVKEIFRISGLAKTFDIR